LSLRVFVASPWLISAHLWRPGRGYGAGEKEYAYVQPANDCRSADRRGRAREVALGFTREDLAACFSEKDDLSLEQFLRRIDGKTTGALRASIGMVSTFADVYAHARFAKGFVDRAI